MRRFLAALILLTFGMSIPFGQTTLRVCLIEHRVLAGAEPCSEVPCCDDCAAGEPVPWDEPCCLEIQKQWDLGLPSPDKAPEYCAVELFQDEIVWTALRPWRPVAGRPLHADLRAPPPREVRRAELGIWLI